CHGADCGSQIERKISGVQSRGPHPHTALPTLNLYAEAVPNLANAAERNSSRKIQRYRIGHRPPSRRTGKIRPRTSRRYIPSGSVCPAESIVRLEATAFADAPRVNFVA